MWWTLVLSLWMSLQFHSIYCSVTFLPPLLMNYCHACVWGGAMYPIWKVLLCLRICSCKLYLWCTRWNYCIYVLMLPKSRSFIHILLCPAWVHWIRLVEIEKQNYLYTILWRGVVVHILSCSFPDFFCGIIHTTWLLWRCLLSTFCVYNIYYWFITSRN